MHNRDIEFFVIDILISIEKVKRYASRYTTVDKFISSDLSISATVRELIIIGEAMKHILRSPNFSHFAEKNWRSMVDFRNYVTHEYFGINYHELFYVIKFELSIFENEFIRFMKIIDKKLLSEAFSSTKKELVPLKRRKTIAYLVAIQKSLEL